MCLQTLFLARVIHELRLLLFFFVGMLATLAAKMPRPQDFNHSYS